MRPTLPLVSCLLVTRDRPAFAALAVRWFARQTWTRRELVVVDGSAVAPRWLPEGDARVRHAPGLPLPARRNLAVDLATGDILVTWDDDDWFAPERLADQVAALATADLCALRTHHVLDLTTGATMEPIRRRPGPGPTLPPALGTLAWWRDGVGGARFGPAAPGEDVAFLEAALAGGARPSFLAGRDRWAQGQHRGSTSRILGTRGRAAFVPGRRPQGMSLVDLAALVAAAAP